MFTYILVASIHKKKCSSSNKPYPLPMEQGDRCVEGRLTIHRNNNDVLRSVKSTWAVKERFEAGSIKVTCGNFQ